MPFCYPESEKRKEKAERVTQIVSRVGQKAKGVVIYPDNTLSYDKKHVYGDVDNENCVERCHIVRMNMCVMCMRHMQMFLIKESQL